MRRVLCCVALLVGCAEAEPRAQWDIVIATDAPVPQLGDRLLVEVLAEDGSLACTGCRRVFAVGSAAAWPLSFGAVPPERAGRFSVRARLHRADHIGSDGQPLGDALLDSIGVLPPIEEVSRVVLTLDMRCFGVPADVGAGATCIPETRVYAPAPTLGDSAALPAPGSWIGAAAEPCQVDPPPGMRCLPGGLVLMGNPLSIPIADPTKTAMPERLVRLSPFFIDIDEVTVGQVRALVMAGMLSNEPLLRAADLKEPGGACTYLGSTVPDNDAMPANCVRHALAAEACASLGKRLPTEAEWEYTASNAGLETPYPWGYSEDACGHAIIGRGRFAEAYMPEPSSCRGLGGDVLPWGPVPGGSDADVTLAGIRNLAGNMREWLADALAAYASPCWSGGAPELHSPICEMGDPPPRRVIRGGGWASFPLSARATEREGGPAQGNDANVGFRCAQSI